MWKTLKIFANDRLCPHCFVKEIVNYKSDRTLFVNQVIVLPLQGPFSIGFQIELTDECTQLAHPGKTIYYEITECLAIIHAALVMKKEVEETLKGEFQRFEELFKVC